MKPTPQEIVAAVECFEILAFFPKDSAPAKTILMKLLDQMVGTKEQLDWLVETMINRIGKWEGPAELRGVFCAYHRPADGIDAVSTAPGFTQDDRNARWMEQEGARITGGDSGTLRLASASEMKALPLPPEEIAKNDALLREVERVADSRRPQSWTVPEPTVEDRAYSRKLLGGIAGLG